MSSDNVEVLDASIVAVLRTSLTQIPQGSALFESEGLKQHMKSVTVSQALQLDATTGNIGPVFTFESMRSQKTASVGASRIDTHDRSGELRVEAKVLAEIISNLASVLGAEPSNVGANFEVTFRLPTEEIAAQRIAGELYRRDYAPEGLQSLGAGARLFLSELDVRYTIIIEPRFNSLETPEVFLTSNANLAAEAMPSIERLVELVERNCVVVQDLARDLFNVSW